ncbi:MAG: leucine-rich repeat domain-containing protein [Ureaplasma sp.]|nr:leucine-rich repeat domain-containing protein [Ureaplasma sp.]
MYNRHEFSSEYNSDIVEFSKNKIIFKMSKSDFFLEELFTSDQLDKFKEKIILQMQANKLTFNALNNVSESNQKTEIINWVCKLLGINNIFSDIEFNKLQASDSYSIKLIANNDYVLGWSNNENDSNDYSIKRKELMINFNKVIEFSNEVLIALKQNINTYLLQQNINYMSWLEHIETKDEEYQNLVNAIYSNLNTLLNNNLVNDYISGLEIIKDNNEIYTLKIIPNSGYKFLSNSNFYEDGNILLIDLDFYSYIQFNENNITSFINRIQATIDTFKYDENNFMNWVNSVEFKNYVSTNLVDINNINVEVSKIENIEYNPIDNVLKISPTSAYRFKLASVISNVSVNENGELLISNLNLYKYINFENLSELFNHIQEFIDNQKFSSNEFLDFVKDSKNLETLKRLVANNLYISADQTIDINKIININFENDNLVISLDSNYVIYSAQNTENVIFSFDTLTIQNLKFFRIVDLIKLDDLFSSLQSFIDTSKYTVNELNNNLDLLKNHIAANLYISETDTISLNQIINVSFETDDVLRVSLNGEYIKYNLTSNINIELENTDLLIKNLNYYKAYDFDNLDNLFNAIQDQIKNNQYTIEEFESYLSADIDSFKNLIANNLYISENETLSVDKIININFDNTTNVLDIELDADYLKYSITTNNHITLTNTTLTISDLNYYSTIEFVDIDLLFNTLQNTINNSKLTADEFKDYVNVTNTDNIKNLIVDNLMTTNNTPIELSNILSVIVNENYKLEITLNVDYIKYVVPSSANITFSNDTLTVNNLVYYQGINFYNINELYNYISNIIRSNQYTPNDFKNYITNNAAAFKTAIASKLLISETDSLNENDILDISLNSNNTLNIKLNAVNKKYIIESNSNITITNNSTEAIINVKNLNLWTSIRFSNLASVRSGIQNIISTYNYTSGDFSTYIRNNQSSLKTLISNNLSKSVTGPGSWSSSQISNVEYSSGNIRITFNAPSYYKYSFDSYSYASISNNVVTITNFSYYSEHSYEWFEWNGTEITGFRANGNTLTSVNIPRKCTKIGYYAFRNNKNLQRIVIPSTVTYIDTGAMEYCSNLSSVTLSEGITRIGAYAFRGTKLSSISIPSSVTDIYDDAFYDIRTLTSVYFNEGLRNIGEYAFGECKGLTVLNFPRTLSELKYRSLRGCDKLRVVNVYSTGTITIKDGTFDYCTSLERLNFINIRYRNYIKPEYWGFNGSSKMKIYVLTSEVKNELVALKYANCNDKNVSSFVQS